MRNKRIIQAYDSINPSPVDRQRMLDAILQEAKLEEPLRKTKKMKEPVVYTAKPTKTSKRSFIGALAASIMMLLIAGFILMQMTRQPIDPSYAEPTTEMTESVETTETFPDGIYAETLAKYRRALDQGWDRTMCVENGMSMLTPIESEYEGLYYAISDLDGNGVEELVISEYPYREDTDTSFIDIYTVLDGRVIQLMSLGDLDMRYLCEGGIVKDLTPPERGDYNAYVSFLEINQDGMFAQTGAVYEIDGQWYHGFRASEKITAAEAEAEVKDLNPLYLDFTEIISSGETEYQSGYEGFDHIIQKYVTAIQEGWTAHRCEENDISPQILEGLSGYQNLGWCLLDIDSNGVEELIVSDGVYLYDLYVMPPHNGGPGHLICANGGETYQLCENGVIQKHGLYSGTSVWRYYTLSDIDLIQRDMVFYEGSANQYSYGTYDNDLQPVSKDKVGDILSRDRTQELTLTPFVERPAFWPDESEYYEPLLNIYRQAIRERWNPGVCVENGISLMVGNYGDFVEELGYTTMDLDNNGIQELIITDGTNIYDLYTIIQDEETGPLRLVDAMERIEYFLTEDNMIYCSGSGGAGMHVYSLSSLEGDHLKMMTGFMYAVDTDPDNPWFWYDGENQGEPCGWDAQPIIDNWKIVDIPFTSFE